MRYDTNRPPMAVILAADVGAQMRPLTDDTAKSMLSIGGSALIERIMRNCLSCGISQFVIVLGHKADQIRQFVDKTFRGVRVTYVINERYRETSTAYALMLARAAVGTAEFIKFDADVVFDVKILRRLVDSDQGDVLSIDRNSLRDDGAVKVVVDDEMLVTGLGDTVDPSQATGGSIGIEKISAATGPRLFADLADLVESPAHFAAHPEVSYARLTEAGTMFHALDMTGLNWTRIDTPADVDIASATFVSPVMTVSRGQERTLEDASHNLAAKG